MTTTAPATSWHYQQARRAIEGTAMTMVGEKGARLRVNADHLPRVWLIADILASDETVVLRWETSNGITVARTMRLAIDKNLPAMLAALAAVEVNA